MVPIFKTRSNFALYFSSNYLQFLLFFEKNYMSELRFLYKFQKCAYTCPPVTDKKMQKVWWLLAITSKYTAVHLECVIPILIKHPQFLEFSGSHKDGILTLHSI